MKPELSIIIPVYNSELSIEELYNRLIKTLKLITPNYEILFIDDYSLDNSFNILRDIKNKNKKVSVITNHKNIGQHKTLLAGIRYSRGNTIITLDDDLQHPPEYIYNLFLNYNLPTLNTNKNIIIYAQYIKRKHGFLKNIASYILNKTLTNTMNLDYNITSFRIFDKLIRNNIIEDMYYHIKNIDVYIYKIIPKNKIGFYNIDFQKRKYGKTTYTIKKIFKYLLDIRDTANTRFKNEK